MLSPSALPSFPLGHIFFFFSDLSTAAPCCPPDLLLLSLTCHLIFNLSPHLSLFMLPLPLPSHIFLLIQTSLAVCWPNVRPEPTQFWPPPFRQPPHCPKGAPSDRALPSDYTGGAGLEYSPEGRQLSISDNCRERHTHADSLLFFPSFSFVNQWGGIT